MIIYPYGSKYRSTKDIPKKITKNLLLYLFPDPKISSYVSVYYNFMLILSELSVCSQIEYK